MVVRPLSRMPRRRDLRIRSLWQSGQLNIENLLVRHWRRKNKPILRQGRAYPLSHFEQWHVIVLRAGVFERGPCGRWPVFRWKDLILQVSKTGQTLYRLRPTLNTKGSTS